MHSSVKYKLIFFFQNSIPSGDVINKIPKVKFRWMLYEYIKLLYSQKNWEKNIIYGATTKVGLSQNLDFLVSCSIKNQVITCIL